MASSSWRGTGAVLNAGYTFGLNGRMDWSSISRTNNTVTFRGVRAQVQVSGSSGTAYSGVQAYTALELPNGTSRRGKTSVGGTSQSVGNVLSTGSADYSFSVGATATTTSLQVGGAYAGDGISWASVDTISIPSAGSPTGVSAGYSAVTATTATLSASVSSWGTNCTAGTGQRIEWKRNADGAWTNEAYSTSTSHTRSKTGLVSNTRYNVRSYVSNGAGRTGGSGTKDFYTLPLAPSSGTPAFDATTVTIPITQNNGGGAYTITKQYRYQAVGGAWSDWTTFTANEVVITGLIPSTDYNIQLRSTTTAGTTTGGVVSLTTLPAGKLVMPDGTVKNAVPRAIYPDGTTKMVQVKEIQ